MPTHSNSNTSCPSPPKRKHPFTFVRSKLETKVREFRKIVYLNGEIYDRNVTTTTLQNALVSNIAVSHSGKTLAEILSLSHPSDLSRYTVDDVTHEYGRAGTVVRYSRPESEIAELRRTVGEMQTELAVLRSKVNELQGKIGEDAEVLAEWQTASLVLCAFGVYTWNLVSDVDKTDLAQYNIHTFWDLYHARFGAGSGRNSARRIYRKLDENMDNYAESLRSMKGSVAASRLHLAHPSIPNERLLKFLAKLGSGNAGLDPLEVEMFNFLRSVSNTEENIMRAIKGGSDCRDPCL